ncbi:MAG: bactofilin family protein [Thermoanaerobaculia bacterium]
MALFSKDPTPTTPAPVRRDTPMPAAGTTYVGPNIIIEGTLSGSEPVIVEGTVRGNVNLTGELRIGTKARVEATVHARSMIIEGRVEGDISADERVELVAGSSVDGNIKAPKIVVAEGARFRGNVDMGSTRPRESTEANAR